MFLWYKSFSILSRTQTNKRFVSFRSARCRPLLGKKNQDTCAHVRFPIVVVRVLFLRTIHNVFLFFYVRSVSESCLLSFFSDMRKHTATLSLSLYISLSHSLSPSLLILHCPPSSSSCPSPSVCLFVNDVIKPSSSPPPVPVTPFPLTPVKKKRKYNLSVS